MKLKLANLNHDVSCLISAFSAAKKTGKFEFKNLLLKEISPDRLNVLNLNTSGSVSGGGNHHNSDETIKRVHFADTNPAEFLKAELQHRDEIICSLKQELKSVRNQYESLINGVSFVIFPSIMNN